MSLRFWVNALAVTVTLSVPLGSAQTENKTKCEECLKDDHSKEVKATKKKPPHENQHSPLVIVVSKNDHYVVPPVVLGDGHELNVELVAPGKILSVEPYQCTAGTSCGWTHEVTITRLTDNKWLWVGWSNSGDNCQLKFTVHYQ